MSAWGGGRAVPQSRRLVSTVKAACTEQAPVREVQCAFSASDTFEFYVKLQDVAGQKKVRIDSFLSDSLPDVSRARLKSSIQGGLVTVNSTTQTKPSYGCKVGDVIFGLLPEPPGTTAEPEDIPLSVTYQDDDVLVVNKAAGMVVHPSPGHYTGTLVNAVLHHFRLPAISLQSPNARFLGNINAVDSSGSVSLQQEVDLDHDNEDHDSLVSPSLLSASAQDVEGVSRDRCTERAGSALRALPQTGNEAVLRPGIVHRLDKGTTGLMVVCRSPVAMLKLGEQFRARSIKRLYYSITVGVPDRQSGEISTNIDRHPTDRLRMAVYGFGSNRGRQAISTYRVVETIGDDSAALVEWRLHTGRTHQIRVHAQHIGCPLLGDKPYEGTHRAISRIGRGNQQREKMIQEIMHALDRPALHAKTLGFKHPVSGQELHFDSDLPDDFTTAYKALSSLPPC